MSDKSNKRIFGSDVVASALRDLDIPYACLNPGASYRGLHDSLVNYLGNERPKMLINLHEEHAVAMAHGYAMVTGEPLIAIVHSNVGLMHATMAVFNAWVDRHPMIIIGATGPVDAAIRRPHIDWIHTSSDQGALLRDYIKWDDQPGSPEAAIESIRKGYQIACTPPYGPVYICLDSADQERELDEWPEAEPASRFTPPPPPGPPAGSVDQALEMIAAAKNPLVLCGRIERTDEAWNDRIAFVEHIGAKAMTNNWQEIGFPTHHPLHVENTGFMVRGPLQDVYQNADLVIGLDWFDLGGTLQSAWNGAPIPSKVINISMDFHQHRGWVKDYGKSAPVDLHIPTIPEAFISEALPKLEATGKRQSYTAERHPVTELAAEGPIGVVPLAQAYRNAVRDRDVCLISHTIGWPSKESEFTHVLGCFSNAGGAGLAAGPGNAVGAALALRDKHPGMLPVAILGDGDYLMGVQALWTASHEDIPLLIIVANNQSYFNDELHQERVALHRDRPPENRWVGQKIAGPDVDLGTMAEAQGFEAPGPVTDMKDLPGALTAALDKVAAGGRILLDVRVTPEYG